MSHSWWFGSCMCALVMHLMLCVLRSPQRCRYFSVLLPVLSSASSFSSSRSGSPAGGLLRVRLMKGSCCCRWKERLAHLTGLNNFPSSPGVIEFTGRFKKTVSFHQSLPNKCLGLFSVRLCFSVKMCVFWFQHAHLFYMMHNCCWKVLLLTTDVLPGYIHCWSCLFHSWVFVLAAWLYVNN